ncbi:Protein of unknown function, DUF1537 [Moorella glycerini]|uniref:Four-carbon acid sugar kinase family protein n=1 Tax=Neomoorella stamsii TaxID=1266720 RepID=A0A9X7J2D7_9FIRM|nr:MULTISPECIES: four-carbon acid sugar kinase family protein [Moorella]PRR72364.1 hypothetical protein MOST_20750 [Moorella stamsii]CEP67373.1 Protein of unknown function, DUF1537 [Moorella glycerini]
MTKIAIIADDLTGANDTGVQFCQHGFRTMVIIDADNVGQVGRDKDVWAINADTRHLTAEEAYRRVYDLALKLKQASIRRIYKKIDSTLRGHPGAELEAVMDAWQAELALVVPAFPSNRRFVQDGYLIIEENPEAKAKIKPVVDITGSAQCHVPRVLRQEMGRRVGQVNLATVRRGASELAAALTAAKEENEVLVLDAVTEDDLQIIARAVGYLPGEVVLAGAAGMAAHLTLAWNLKTILGPYPAREGNVLLIAGSRNPVTAVQVREVADFSGCWPLEVDTGAILRGQEDVEIERAVNAAVNREAIQDLLIIAVDSLFRQSHLDSGQGTGNQSTAIHPNGAEQPATGNSGKDFDSKAIATALGAIASHLLATIKVRGLVITGGDTAVHVCRALGARGINLATEILPGIPLGYLEGGQARGLPIVTKAGGFGPPDAFIKVFKYLIREANL